MNAPYSETLFLTCGTQEVLKWAASKSGSKTKYPLLGPPPGLKLDGRGTGSGLAYRKCGGLQEVRWSTGSAVAYRKLVGLQEVGWPTGSGLTYRKCGGLQEVD